MSTAGGTRTDDPSKIPWDRIQADWEEREHKVAPLVESALGGSAVKRVDALLFAPDLPSEEKTLGELRQGFAAAAAVPDGELLLALYLYGRCLDKWEQTEDYHRIRTVLGAMDEAALRRDGASSDRHALLSIIVSQAQALDQAMGVEEAMNCSCPVAMGERARSVVTDLDLVLELEQALHEGPNELREVVRSDAETSRCYFEAIDKVAGAVLAFVMRDTPGPADFDEVLDALRQTERDPALEGDVYESELRAHRATLEALRDRAAKPRLRIDAAEVVYLYPFALEGPNGEEIDADDTVTQALGDVVVAALEAAGLRPLSARELDLNDLWDRPDVADHERYSGASITLPPITVETTAYEQLDDFKVVVRLSRLGNHHLLVRSPLENAGLHEVNQALRRGSHGMGAETLRSGGRKWTKFPRYVRDVVETVASALHAKAVSNLDAEFHVVLAARSISVQQPDGSAAPATLAELKQAVGASLLFHPIRHLTTSLEEWIRYRNPPVTNLLDRQGYTGELVARTDNTTVTFMPASPEWLVGEYEEMIEFVASIPPLFTLWENRALRLADDLDAVLEKSEQRNDASADTLHAQEMRIRGLEGDIRGQLALLRSPALCRTRGQRRFLDNLWKAAGLATLERELERRLTLLAERQERIAAMLRRKQQEHARKQQEHAERLGRRVEIVLGIIAAVSLAGVLQWMNDAFGVDGHVWAWVEAAILLAAAVLVVIAIFVWKRGSG